MFDSSLIVQSAISSFNNVAISAPSFFWYAVFMLPLFYVAHIFGANIMSQMNLPMLNDSKKRLSGFSFIIQISILLWLILMPGNYDVLRDDITILPFIIAGLIFVMTASITSKLLEINPKIPTFLQKIKQNRYLSVASFILLSGLIGLTGFHSWWGILLQSVAFMSGAIFGRYSGIKNNLSIKFITTIIFVLTTAILMQPEFFRFGQLGNLTLVHILFVFMTGIVAIGIFTLGYIKSHGKFRDSFFKKIKWLFRLILLISVLLFFLTESVLIFLGLSVVLFLSFAISVWHQSESIPENAHKKLWAVLLILFGVITVLPVITIIGILYWNTLPKIKMFDKLKFLL